MNTFQPLLKDAELLGIHKPDTKPPIIRTSDNPQIKKLSYTQFQERLGLPYSRITNKRVPLTTYQITYHNAIKKYHKVLVNKTKKGGFTDGFIRHTATEAFDSYAGHEVVFMAGNKASIALDVLKRFNLLFEENNGFTDQNDKRWTYGDIVLQFKRSPTDMSVEFYNGFKAIGSSASKGGTASPVRGLSDVAMWFLTEAAHTGATSDYRVVDGLTSLTGNRDYGDEIMETTPNGTNGIFYKIFYDATNGLKNKFKIGKNGWYPMEYNYEIAVKEGVLSKVFIERQKKDKRVNFGQEYNCEFTSSANSAFDPLTEDDYTEGDAIDFSTL